MELNENTYETYLLLYIDNELSAQERAAVEAYLYAHPALQADFELLKSTIQKTPDVLFEEKALLYRFEALEASLETEFKNSLYKKAAGTIVPIGFKKILSQYTSIAALVLIVLGMGFYYFHTNIQNSINIASNHFIHNRPTLVAAKVEKPSKNMASLAQTSIPEATSPSQVKKENNTMIVATDTSMLAQTTTLIQPSPIVFDNTVLAKSTEPASHETPIVSNTAQIENKEVNADVEEINTDDNDRIIYISNFELDGDKIRGLTRRVSALFKRNKTDKN